MRLDLHVHSHWSPDSRLTLEEAVDRLEFAGLSGFALTDHNSIAGHRELRALEARYPMYRFIPGVEVSTHEGHLLVYGIEALPPIHAPLADTLEWVRARGAVAVLAHPFRWARRGRAHAGRDRRRERDRGGQWAQRGGTQRPGGARRGPAVPDGDRRERCSRPARDRAGVHGVPRGGPNGRGDPGSDPDGSHRRRRRGPSPSASDFAYRCGPAFFGPPGASARSDRPPRRI